MTGVRRASAYGAGAAPHLSLYLRPESTHIASWEGGVSQNRSKCWAGVARPGPRRGDARSARTTRAASQWRAPLAHNTTTHFRHKFAPLTRHVARKRRDAVP